MKEVILASASPQRKKLLASIGLPFSVRPSRAKEITEITSTCAALVQKNALLKAEAVAREIPSGVVIGADTVVYAGQKRLIGKPATHQEAREILRVLFSKPRWIYTGVAVIDKDSGKVVKGYEKTRVFMHPLTEEEMKAYHQRVNPFDKAGGFDIEGFGSIFIYRIEGCYSNVIGLPVARTVRMLKEVGVRVL